MPNEQNPTPNGVDTTADEAPKSLREVAEAAWNEAESTAEEPPAGEPPLQEGPTRDNLGRFTSAKTDEGQSPDPAQHTQQPASQEPQQPIQPAPPQGNEAPQHWAQQDREMFAKLPKEGQEFLLRRHTDMERDYTAKTQAAATAVQFTQQLAPVFEHQAVKAALVDYQTGQAVHPADAIKQWAAMHVRAMSPNVQDRIGLIKDLMQRCQLDPAAVFGQSNQPTPGLSEQDLADPAIRYFADHVAKTAQEVQALRSQLEGFNRQQDERTAQETLRVTKWGIDSFADEKDAQGNPMHPHFDTVLPYMIDLFKANPQRDLREAYETAVWMHPELRSTLIQQERQTVEQKQANQRAAAAARSNVRGRTSPVAKPGADGEEPKGLRAVIAAAADEVGI